MTAPEILFIDSEAIANPAVMNHLYRDMTRDYYVADDWSPQFYCMQAARGFIAVGYQTPEGTQLLLPQIQKSYCVLDWDKLDNSASIRKQVKKSNFRMKINANPASVIEKISEYHGSKNWVCSKYKDLCMRLFQAGNINVPCFTDSTTVFRMCSVELYQYETLIAGELGYIIGSVFTSLTGFCKREKKISIGKIQIFALASILRSCGFKFLNLGQPPENGLMQYKADLGGVTIERLDFIAKWIDGIRATGDLGKFISTDILVSSLL